MPREIVTHHTAAVNETMLHYIVAGNPSAPPLVLLHGFPESWLMWFHILPVLAAKYRVVAPDLRGYGDSAKPAGEAGYDKGTMAADIHALVQSLGITRFVLVGHDRGGRVARRYALDYPGDLAGIALLDILPVEYVYDRLSAAEVAAKYWHWIFQLVPELPEELIAGHEEAYLSRFFARTPGLLDQLRDDGTWSEYLRCFTQPGAVAAGLNDYRATYVVDVPRYRAERVAGVTITTPLLLLWGARGNLAGRAVLDIWGEVATEIRGGYEIADCGHYLPEEQPDAVLHHLLPFIASCNGEAESI